MKTPETLDEIVARGLGDASVRGFRWIDENPTFVISLEVPAFPTKILHLHFAWPAGLTIQMDFGDYLGQALVFDAQLHVEGAKKSFEIFFEAAPQGLLALSFNDVGIVWEDCGHRRPNALRHRQRPG